MTPSLVYQAERELELERRLDRLAELLERAREELEAWQRELRELDR